jgi:hypothetical protein
LASLVPVIVNAVLNEHQLVLDIVSFVAMGDFPRSRLGEKQRGKVLATWVSRKMRTIAQFSIRDPDAEGSVSTVGPADVLTGRRGSGQSGHAGTSIQHGVSGSSLRQVESLSNLPGGGDGTGDQLTVQTDHTRSGTERSGSRNDVTPTNENPRPFDLNDTIEYSPVENSVFDSPEQLTRRPRPSQEGYEMRATYGAPDDYDPYGHAYQQDSPQELHGSGAGLRVANVTNSAGNSDWEQEALRSMNIGR